MALSKPNTSSQVMTSDDGEPETAGGATMADLPPEILTLILEYLLDGQRNAILRYRLINSEWKSIIDSHLEKKMVSRRLVPFPEARLGYLDESCQLYADCCPTLLLEGRNPFPFNSVFVEGSQNWKPEALNQFYEVHTALTGSNLSSFTLSCHQLATPQLATMLGWMPCLKRLSLCCFYLYQSGFIGAVFPSPPPLPCLASLELKMAGYRDASRAPCLWLLVSYADQLVYLSIKATDAPFDPLRKQSKYRINNFSGENILIGSTSAAAFGKLKELQVYRPSHQFLQASETPVLQHFLVTGLATRWGSRKSIGLQDMTKFIDGCSGTLRTLFLDVTWNEWVNDGKGTFERGQPKTATKLKTITIHYPKDDSQKTLLDKSSLLKFSPGLELLQLTNYGTEMDAAMMDPNYNEINLEIHSGDEKERAELKEKLASLEEREAVLQEALNGVLQRKREARMARKTKPTYGWQQYAAERRVIIQLWKEHAVLAKEIDLGRQEKAPLFNRLFVLNRKAAIARELRERGIWNNCPKLKIVSVSSGVMVSGDVCVLRRMDVVGLQ